MKHHPQRELNRLQAPASVYGAHGGDALQEVNQLRGVCGKQGAGEPETAKTPFARGFPSGVGRHLRDKWEVWF